MLQLYHARTAVCAAKVRIALAEKRLSWEGFELDLSAGDQFAKDYLRINAKGVVPTLVHDGRVIVESTVINEYLDDAFAAWPLRAPDSFDRARMRLWTKREDSFHAAINTVTLAIVLRLDLLNLNDDERHARIANIPDPVRRAKWLDIVENGMHSAHVRDAMLLFQAHMRDMQEVLDVSLWLGGKEFSLADVGLVSFFHRLQILKLDFMWLESCPAVTQWFQRCKGRPSFEEGVERYLSTAYLARYSQRAALAQEAAIQSFETALSFR